MMKDFIVRRDKKSYTTSDYLPLPDEGDRVLALFKGEWIVLEVGVEYPSFEETFESFKYWFEPFFDSLDVEVYDVDIWMELPDIPEDLVHRLRGADS